MSNKTNADLRDCQSTAVREIRHTALSLYCQARSLKRKRKANAVPAVKRASSVDLDPPPPCDDIEIEDTDARSDGGGVTVLDGESTSSSDDVEVISNHPQSPPAGMMTHVTQTDSLGTKKAWISLGHLGTKHDVEADGDCLGHSLRFIEQKVFSDNQNETETKAWRKMIENAYAVQKRITDMSALYSSEHVIGDVPYLTDEVISCWAEMHQTNVVVISYTADMVCDVILYGPGDRVSMVRCVSDSKTIEAIIRFLSLKFFIVRRGEGIGSHYSVYIVTQKRTHTKRV